METTECQPCSDDGNQKEAYGFCQDCGEYLCQDCYLGHCKPRPMRSHTLLDMDQMKETPKIKKKDTTNEVCTQHGGEYIKYFCSTHNVTGCSACITIDHLNCSGNVVFIPQVAESVVNSEELQSLKRNIKSMRTPLTDMITTSADNIARVEDNHAEMTTAILEYGEEISSTIQKLEKSSRNEADAFKQESLDNANVAISMCKESLSSLNDMTKELKLAEETGNYCKLFIAVKTHIKSVKTIQGKVKQLTMKNMVKSFMFKPLKELRSFLTKFDGLGVFSDEPSSPDCSIEYSSSEPEREEKAHINVNASFLHELYIRSVSDQKNTCQVTYMTLVTRNQLVLINRGKTIKLVDISRDKVVSELQFDGSEYSYTIRAVAKIDNHRVVVGLADGQCFLVKVGTALLIDRLIATTSLSHMSYYPDDGLYACYGGSKITKFDLYGNETTVIESKPVNGVMQGFSSSLIKSYVSKEIRYYVVAQDLQQQGYGLKNTGSPYIACLAPKGKITEKIKFENKPEDIVVDDTGGVLFVLSGGVVHVLEAGATEARALWTKTNGLCRACALAYCPDNKRLYVGMRDSNNVKVYQLSGMPRS